MVLRVMTVSVIFGWVVVVVVVVVVVIRVMMSFFIC